MSDRHIATRVSVLSQLPDTPLEPIHWPIAQRQQVQVWLKRDDLLHPRVSGNKFFKLAALHQQLDQQRPWLSFGGAFSNHLHALAAFGNIHQQPTIGLIRDTEAARDSPMVLDAQSWGMQCHFLSRQDYRRRHQDAFIESLGREFGDIFVIPEGGSSLAAVRECAQMATRIQTAAEVDWLAVAVGTGASLAGICSALSPTQRALGMAVLKRNQQQRQDISDWLSAVGANEHQRQWVLNENYHGGGYAVLTPDLLEFIVRFWQEQGILLDPVYSSKLLYGLYQMIADGYFPPDSRIAAIHTGGLQGWRGMRDRVEQLLPATSASRLLAAIDSTLPTKAS